MGAYYTLLRYGSETVEVSKSLVFIDSPLSHIDCQLMLKCIVLILNRESFQASFALICR